MRRLWAVATGRATPLCRNEGREADGVGQSTVAAMAAAERICGCDGGDDGTREKKGSFLFICVVVCNGPLKLVC